MTFSASSRRESVIGVVGSEFGPAASPAEGSKVGNLIHAPFSACDSSLERTRRDEPFDVAFSKNYRLGEAWWSIEVWVSNPQWPPARYRFVLGLRYFNLKGTSSRSF